ncbi:hypothetical protein [Psychrobacter sp. FDAARGOS_221]|uniref:hypothetical protein n=1 Tax=Psychrobacter sp. FDAARGOS_221 TaxID=1975705 RepID=UPI000BB53E59|nr:hypothetical protein [Psychrobacter sp. FDAARGOS_221]PNK61390.1 hypothetical protein A6J60_011305 [Psychrobacter sp. FDAARGOS_221]
MINSKNIAKMLLASALFSTALTAQAMPTSEVTFESGSNCGHYEGDLAGGRVFTLQLAKDQQLVVSSDGHVQSVVDSKGTALEDQGGANYRYVALHSGTHQIKMAGRATSSADFCIN